MTDRTEDQKMSQEPLSVALGGKTYTVRLLTIKESREWRKKAVAPLAMMPGVTSLATDIGTEGVKQSLTELMSTAPDLLVDLFFDYAKDLPRDEIEATANDIELVDALDQVLSVAFPLARGLVTLAKATGKVLK